MEQDLRVINENVLKLMAEVSLIKNVLMKGRDEEGNLSDWAKDELAVARREGEDNFTSLEDL